MPDQENTEGKKDGEQELPEKYRGKSAAEIAAMHESLEAKLGEQGTELGQLRQVVADLSATRAASTREREQADKVDYSKSKYAKYGEELIVSPDEALPRLVDELKADLRAELMRETSQQLTNQQQVEQFFRQNADLEPYREIVSVIGERIYQMNPNASMAQILEKTRQESLKYIGSLRERMGAGRGKDADRKRAAITTSGGKARESVAESETEETPESNVDPEKAAVLDEIRRIKEARDKRLQPPRAR